MGIPSSWDGTLSSSDFHVAATALSEKWKATNLAFPPWTWVPCSRLSWGASCEVEGYLSLENLCHHESHQASHRCSIETQAFQLHSKCYLPLELSLQEDCNDGSYSGKEEPNYNEKEEPTDSATLVHSYSQEIHLYDFHIVYSASYRVPVLYFRGYRCDGQPLAWDDIEKDLSPNSLKMLKESKWTFMTKEEHPYLNRPWYTLHPCGTSDWMKLMFLDAASSSQYGAMIQQYLVSWLSVVGQAVGLRVPLEMLS